MFGHKIIHKRSNQQTKQEEIFLLIFVEIVKNLKTIRLLL
jgi:hypothetical protein